MKMYGIKNISFKISKLKSAFDLNVCTDELFGFILSQNECDLYQIKLPTKCC